MVILFAATELAPYAKTGGLADVLASLPSALGSRGHQVRICLPFYRRAIRKLRSLQPMGIELEVVLGRTKHVAHLWRGQTSDSPPLLLIEKDEFFDRSYLYGPPGRDYADNASRFFFFSKAVVQIAQRLSPRPDVLHLHDWHTGLAAVIARRECPQIKTVFTIHNIAYQGKFPAADFELTNLPWEYFTPEGIEFYGQINCLKAGIVFSNRVTTVSPRHAQEIQSPGGGHGLEGVLQAHRQKLVGILNGADYRRWNPATDRKIPASFDAGHLKGKEICKEVLCRELGFPSHTDPLFLFLGRLVEQKGVELLLQATPYLLSWGSQIAVLGTGTPKWEKALEELSRQNPDRLHLQFRFSERLAHRFLAGADFLLMPSAFEPCGLTQMYALRYGTLPIAHATGGLADTIQDAIEPFETGTGFLFSPYELPAFLSACQRALRVYQDPSTLVGLRKRAMGKIFSWDEAALQYEAIYQDP